MLDTLGEEELISELVVDVETYGIIKVHGLNQGQSFATKSKSAEFCEECRPPHRVISLGL